MATTIQGAMIVTLKGKQAVGVESIEDAIKACANFRDTSDYGFGIGAEKYYSARAGRIFVGTKQIGRVHYNGRVEMK
jgi:hypothetical protein